MDGATVSMKPLKSCSLKLKVAGSLTIIARTDKKQERAAYLTIGCLALSGFRERSDNQNFDFPSTDML